MYAIRTCVPKGNSSKTTYSDHDSSKTILPVVGSLLGQTMCESMGRGSVAWYDSPLCPSSLE